MESLKATAKHIRQVAGDIPAAQIQLMCHQHMELPARNYCEGTGMKIPIGCVVGWYMVLHQFLDNSDSPFIVEQ